MEITLADPTKNIDLIKSSLRSWKLRGCLDWPVFSYITQKP